MVRESAGGKPRGKISPFGFFVKMCYEAHRKKYPNEKVEVPVMAQKLSNKWTSMTEPQKQRFYELAQKDAERYSAEVKAFGGEKAMRKRKRAKKDPNAPKCALTAFLFFSQIKRPEVSGAHPNYNAVQIRKEMAQMWKALSDEEKKTYEEMAIRDKGRYENEMRDYKAGRTRWCSGRVSATDAAASTSAVQSHSNYDDPDD